MTEPDDAIEERGFTRTLARWLVKRYYPRIRVTNGDRIPQSGPVLLCANHTNSLIDPVLIGIAARRPVRFLAKAPLFDNPITGPPLRALGMIPAFRGSDDISAVRRNIESLGVGAKALAAGQAMGIFPEGKSSDQAHLEMVRSGAARMAIQASEEGAQGLLVVPMGISYERKDAFRTPAWVQVGRPIEVDALLATQDGNPRKARRALTQELTARLKEVVTHLEEPEWEPWLNDLQTLAALPAKGKHTSVPPLERRKQLADAMNHFLADDRARAESLAGEVEVYREQVHAAGLRVDSPVLRWRGVRVAGELLWRLVTLALLLLPALIGTVHHLVPFVVVRALAAKLDQPGRKTVSTHRLLVGLPIYLLWYGLVAWILFASDLPVWFVWTWLAIAPACGVIAIHYWRRAGRTARLLWHQMRMTLNHRKLGELRQVQAQVRERIGRLAADYEQRDTAAVS